MKWWIGGGWSLQQVQARGMVENFVMNDDGLEK